MIYFLAILVTLYLLPIKNEKIKFAALFLSFLVLALFRYGIGADYFSYGYIYETINTESLYHVVAWNLRYEPFFKLFFALFKVLGFSYISAHSIIGSLLFTLTSIWIYRNTDKPFFSLFLYISMFYFVWSLSALRQAIVLIGAMFLLFDKKEYSLKVKTISILILTLFHYSGLFLFVIVLFNYFSLSKKQMFILIAGSIIISLLPINSILKVIPFIPFKDRLLYYFKPGFTFMNFGYLIRLSLTVLFVLFYDYLEKIDKKLLDNILFGFMTYFIFSFSPITAGRLSIYTYLLIVLLVPKIEFNGNLRRVSYAGLLLVSSLYYIKEVNALVGQAALENKYVIPTVFNKEKYSFDDYDYYLLKRKDEFTTIKQDFSDSLLDKEMVGYDENDFNFAGWNPHIHGYSIYNTKGEFSIDYPMKGSPIIYKDVLVNYYDIGSLFRERRYIDLSNQGRTLEELKAYTYEYIIESDSYEDVLDSEVDISFDQLPDSTKSIFEFPNNIQKLRVFEITEPLRYHIMQVNYYYYDVYVYLDADLQPLSRLMFDNAARFDQTMTLQNQIRGNKLRLNAEGKLIWVELYD